MSPCYHDLREKEPLKFKYHSLGNRFQLKTALSLAFYYYDLFPYKRVSTNNICYFKKFSFLGSLPLLKTYVFQLNTEVKLIRFSGRARGPPPTIPKYRTAAAL